MTYRRAKHWQRLLAIALGVMLLAFLTSGTLAQDGASPDAAAEEEALVEEVLTAETVQTNLNQIWLLLAGFLVFFMQAGFAMLEGGFIRSSGVVNSMAENFMDAAVTAIAFFVVGFGIAYGNTLGAGTYESSMFLMDGMNGTGAGDGIAFIDWFFQFAFAGAAATIATGAMAERTDFRGKLIYSAILGAFLYPVVVHLTWGGGFLAANGYLDFAGSGIVHQFGGVVALVGAIIVGPRVGRVFGKPPAPSNMMLATMGTFVLWFGWYGFNVGSTLEATDPNALGLVVINTTLAAATGALAAMFFAYFTKGGKWDLSFILNGSLAGLVGITAGCAFVAPVASLIIGAVAGVVVVLAVAFTEMMKVDDAVGAFSVHGAWGALGALAIGFWGIPELTGTDGGLFMGGGLALLGTQLMGVIVITLIAAVGSAVVFGVLRAVGLLRMPAAADAMGIDIYEHGATAMPDLLPMPGDTAIAGSDARGAGAAPAVGD